MRLDKKLLLTVPTVIALFAATGSAYSNFDTLPWEEQHKIKYGRYPPQTERRLLEARKARDKDSQAVQAKKDRKEAEKKTAAESSQDKESGVSAGQ
jgi:hypothetical protein